VFPDFCAAYIQAAWKSYVICKAYRKYKVAREQEIENLQQQVEGEKVEPVTNAVKEFHAFVASKPTYSEEKSRLANAARTIQHAWKKFYVKCI
jgi:hypothetical protein